MTKIVRRLVVRYQLQYVGSFGFHQCFRGWKMKKPLSILACALVIGVGAVSSHAWAQAKTAKACTEEWRADKAGFQAKGITEKAYVADCRAGTASTPAAPAPAPTATAPAPSPATAAPAPAAPRPTAASPAQAPAAPTARTAPTGSPSGAGQFATEAQAKATCPADTVVWVNLTSKIYHFSGTHNYGTTKNGAYMCEKDTAAQGMRAAKNEQHP